MLGVLVILTVYIKVETILNTVVRYSWIGGLTGDVFAIILGGHDKDDPGGGGILTRCYGFPVVGH